MRSIPLLLALAACHHEEPAQTGWDDCAGMYAGEVEALRIVSFRSHGRLPECDQGVVTVFTDNAAVEAFWQAHSEVEHAARPTLVAGQQMVCFTWYQDAWDDMEITSIRQSVVDAFDLAARRSWWNDGFSADTGFRNTELWVTPTGRVEVCDYEP
ncbi:MAG: hypothetical protein ABIO70_29450 [Pseudomonadota bacterium]